MELLQVLEHKASKTPPALSINEEVRSNELDDFTEVWQTTECYAVSKFPKGMMMQRMLRVVVTCPIIEVLG